MKRHASNRYPGSRFAEYSWNYLLIVAALIPACSTVTVLEDGSTVRRHFGYVKVITPPAAGTKGNFQAVEYSTLGLRVGNGLGIGYYYERYEYIPLDCRIVIRVINDKQLDDVVDRLSFLKKEGLCVTVDASI